MSPLIPRRREPPHRTRFGQLLLLSHVIESLSLRNWCNEATSAFTARCNLVICACSFLSMLSEGITVLLSLHGASPATRLESIRLGRTFTDWLMCPCLDTPTNQPAQ